MRRRFVFLPDAPATLKDNNNAVSDRGNSLNGANQDSPYLQQHQLAFAR
jgi:hypothetical protein